MLTLGAVLCVYQVLDGRLGGADIIAASVGSVILPFSLLQLTLQRYQASS